MTAWSDPKDINLAHSGRYCLSITEKKKKQIKLFSEFTTEAISIKAKNQRDLQVFGVKNEAVLVKNKIVRG